jgi:hypothetical protein
MRLKSFFFTYFDLKNNRKKIIEEVLEPLFFLWGVFNPNKISGVGTSFGLLVHVLPGPNKQRAFT